MLLHVAGPIANLVPNLEHSGVGDRLVCFGFEVVVMKKVTLVQKVVTEVVVMVSVVVV